MTRKWTRKWISHEHARARALSRKDSDEQRPQFLVIPSASVVEWPVRNPSRRLWSCRMATRKVSQHAHALMPELVCEVRDDSLFFWTFVVFETTPEKLLPMCKCRMKQLNKTASPGHFVEEPPAEPKHDLNQTVKFEPNLEYRVRGFPALPLKLVELNKVCCAGFFGSRR